MTLSGSTFYGMTYAGGSQNIGAVYKINTDGTGYSTLYSFSGGSDGSHPKGTPVLLGSTLYGMSYMGGANNYGTVFKVNTDGTGFSVLHNFAGGSDGSYSTDSLTLIGSTLYGMTPNTLFKINTDGSGYSVLHSLGFAQYSSLTASGSTLYGMDGLGGAYGDGYVFKINTDGTGFTRLHDFTGDSTQSGWPAGNLVLSGSTLYGTSGYCVAPELGAVFKVNTDGTDFGVLHTFTGNPDGLSDYGTVTLVGSNLYGMTARGGTSGNGIIFEIGTNGTGYNIVHQFAGSPSDGAKPYGGGLILNGTTLYGTAEAGGISNSPWPGNGVIFTLQLAPEPSSFVLSALGLGGLAAARRRRSSTGGA